MDRRRATITTTALGLVLGALVLGTGLSPSQAGSPSGDVYVVQAVPRKVVSVSVDGKQVERTARTGDVVGPLSLPPGSHEIELASTSWSVSSTVKVVGGKVMDVVLHSPAAQDGDPVVSTYDVPEQPIGPGKARVVLAHTATAPPADVSVDGTTVFTNIANGEFAEADLPSGAHRVALLPSGSARGAFLGPLGVSLRSETVTMVYAVGSPRNNSMDVVAHSAGLSSDGSVTPSRIETGSAGMVRELVAPFGR